MEHERQLLLARINLFFNLLVLTIACPDLSLLPLALFDELLVALLKLIANFSELNKLTLGTLLRLRQSLQVDEHGLVVLSQLLHLLLFQHTTVLYSRNFLILLLDHHRHLLCLSFKVDERLLGFVKLLRDSSLHLIVALLDLCQLHLSIDFFRLKLILQLLLPLLGLV